MFFRVVFWRWWSDLHLGLVRVFVRRCIGRVVCLVLVVGICVVYRMLNGLS